MADNKPDVSLQQLLDAEWKKYRADLENLEDLLADQIEGLADRNREYEIPDLILDTVREADSLAQKHYDTVRLLWQRDGKRMPEFARTKRLDPGRVLWDVSHGVAHTDWNGLTYTQLIKGESKAGVTLDDLWSIAAYGPHWRGKQMSLDDW